MHKLANRAAKDDFSALIAFLITVLYKIIKITIGTTHLQHSDYIRIQYQCFIWLQSLPRFTPDSTQPTSIL